MRKATLTTIPLLLILSCFAFSDDGTYDATVTTDSGSYSVSVEVEDGEVTQVHWPNGGDMSYEKFIEAKNAGLVSFDIDIDENGKMKVLYVGAASGIHTRMLDMLYFGLFKWILYDPNEFDSKLVKYSKIYDTDINFINQYFTVEKSKKFIDFTSGGIFISDLRTETDDQSIMENLKLQNDCAKIMLPSVSYLKFRMPFYKPAKVETYYSQIVHQIWAKRNSGEMRTVVYRDEWQKSPKIIDIRQYEESIHGFNLINRRTSYNKCKNSYCKCFDCWAEEAVIKQYLGKKANGSDEKGESYVDIMKNFISEFLSSEGTRINHKEFYSYDRSKYNEKKFIEFLEELK